MLSPVKLYKTETHFSDLEKEAIVAECVSEIKWNSVKAVAKANNTTPSFVTC